MTTLSSNGISNGGGVGASGDGSIIVGVAITSGSRAFRWSASSGIELLTPTTPQNGFLAIEAEDSSNDGTVGVGWGSNLVNGSGTTIEAFRWSGGGITLLGDLAGGATNSAAQAISPDGSVIVGYGHSTLGREAFRWTAASGMVGLGDLPQGIFESEAHAVSANGSVVAGWSSSTRNGQAFRWTAAEGMVSLGVLHFGGVDWDTYALDISADGSVIVGGATQCIGCAAAFIWDAQNGIRELEDVLQNQYGVDLSGWGITSATAISDDGRTIVGTGNHNGCIEGWMAVLSPNPTAVPSLPWISSYVLLAMLLVGAAQQALRRRRPTRRCS